MPEIMSAEDLANRLREKSVVHENPNSDFYYLRSVIDTPEGVDVIRSRDSAMLEKYKEAIRSMSTGGLIGEDEAIAILDSAFSEIEGGK